MRIERFEDIIAWQKAKELAVKIYRLFETSKDYSFKDQIQRASVSVMNNIAEGFERKTNNEFKQFLFIAKGSCGEVRSMLILAKELNKIEKNTMKKLTLLVAVIATSFTTFAQVGIGTTTPNASAALDITSTTSGLLPPRMTEAQRNVISTPAAGLMVYCTNCGTGEPQYYNGTSWVNMVGAAAAVSIPSVTSATTGKTWMDRNLGATQVATSSTDADSYGDLYQWGRNSDGHQIRGSSIAGGPVASGAEGTSFITSTSDWLTVPDDTRWAASKTANDPCPTGFKVPTDTELEAERNNGGTGFWGTGSLQNNALGAFNSALKLPLAGYRSLSAGALTSVGSFGAYWSSTVSGTNARSLNFNSSNAGMYSDTRAYGFSVRCIKE